MDSIITFNKGQLMICPFLKILFIEIAQIELNKIWTSARFQRFKINKNKKLKTQKHSIALFRDQKSKRKKEFENIPLIIHLIKKVVGQSMKFKNIIAFCNYMLHTF